MLMQEDLRICFETPIVFGKGLIFRLVGGSYLGAKFHLMLELKNGLFRELCTHGKKCCDLGFYADSMPHKWQICSFCAHSLFGLHCDTLGHVPYSFDTVRSEIVEAVQKHVATYERVVAKELPDKDESNTVPVVAKVLPKAQLLHPYEESGSWFVLAVNGGKKIVTYATKEEAVVVAREAIAGGKERQYAYVGKFKSVYKLAPPPVVEILIEEKG